MAKRTMDAWDLLVWALRDQRVGGWRGLLPMERQLDDERYEPHGSSSDGIAVISRIAAVGCRIDGGEHANLTDRVHPDAVAVVKAVKAALDPMELDLVCRHARHGLMPEPPTTMPAPQPMPYVDTVDRLDVDARGKVRDNTRRSFAQIGGRKVAIAVQVADWVAEQRVTGRVRDRRGKVVKLETETVQVPVEFCPVRYEPDPLMVAADAGLYRAFVTAMGRVAAALAGAAFRDHECSGFVAPFPMPEPLVIEMADARVEQLRREGPAPVLLDEAPTEAMTTHDGATLLRVCRRIRLDRPYRCG